MCKPTMYAHFFQFAWSNLTMRPEHMSEQDMKTPTIDDQWIRYQLDICTCSGGGNKYTVIEYWWQTMMRRCEQPRFKFTLCSQGLETSDN